MFLNEWLNSWKENLTQLWCGRWRQERLQVRPLYLLVPVRTRQRDEEGWG